MYCWYCGTKLPGAAAYCHRCGQSQHDSAMYDPAARPLVPDGWPWSTAPTTDPPPAPTSNQPVEVPAEPEHASPPLTVVVDVAETAITELAPSAAPSATDQTESPSRLPGLLGIACGVLVVAGSLGPWVTARIVPREPVTILGSEVDGQFTLWCGLAAVICLSLLVATPSRGGLGIVAAGAFFLAALIGIADWTNFSVRIDELTRPGAAIRLEAEIGWGLPTVTLGSLLGTVLAMTQALQSRRAAGKH